MNKTQIRKHLLDSRNNLKNKNSLSTKLNQKVINHIQNISENAKIASFLSLKNETDTSLINTYFDNIYLPIVHPFVKHGLWFAKDSKNYYLNKYKIKEPIYKPQDIVAPWELDVIIVPVVGFTKDRYRMGMGGGFYDFSLSFKNTNNVPITIGIAFDEQQNDAIIINTYDIQLDTIITPTRIL
ncbi:5-formyltetrahydrofolate cyclo-ligase [Francisella halioticida]|uniref:5-formyltetrahydrofolate cyclo-ligase n=1 Tax=Francisella halioticida TaxID=549298 RepID=A0ABM6M284_9GAMM|nr:5-formyltetrahydrofolate cyclo-ligase [Francisella halioticida]ASG68992.1 5-formyltetrahydrofolate cyclo-ligase [Francisella halioticida]BCD90096.1 5-formyltetrahydrofolate cyclo-ligase [Francisella halioticida]